MESKIVTDDKESTFKGILKDKKYYMWSGDASEGIMIDLTKFEKNTETPTPGTQVQSKDDIIDKLEANKQNCKSDSFSEDRFELPEDVKFSDLSL